MSETSDLTAVYYTAYTIPESFAGNVRKQLAEALNEQYQVITIGRLPDVQPSHVNIYRQALQGAKLAETKYIALCEDDILYSPEHFKYRPKDKKFAYNMNSWNIFTWGEPVFSQKFNGRVNLSQLICEREAFIEAMEERFAKYPDESEVDLSVWAEPGKYERQLGVSKQAYEHFTTNPANIIFSHQTALSYQNLGERKRLGEIRATEVPYWGSATKIKELYK